MMRLTYKVVFMVFIGGLCVLGASWVQAQEQEGEGSLLAVLQPVKDNTLYQNAAGSLSNGAGGYFFAGTTANNEIRRGLLAFDVAGMLPPDATIESVELVLHMSMTISGGQAIKLHRVTSNWGEGLSDAAGEEGGGAGAMPGDATWLHTFYATDFWTMPGGDFVSLPSATTSVVSFGFYTWGSTPEMVADVQAWVDHPATNFGWVLLGNETANATAKRFDARENGNVDFRPVLRVVYTTNSVRRIFIPLVTRSS